MVPTSIWSIPENRAAMLELTRDHGFGLYDPQIGRLYDPRGHIRITTQLGDGHDVPYLSPGLLAELFDHPHPENPWVIIERRDHHYIQSRFTPGEMVEVEHRRGGPDHHYGAATADRQLAQRVLWGWATGSTDCVRTASGTVGHQSIDRRPLPSSGRSSPVATHVRLDADTQEPCTKKSYNSRTKHCTEWIASYVDQRE